MLRLLMQAAAGFATFNLGRRIALLKRSAGFFAVAGVLGLLGLGALTASAIILLAERLRPAEAAAAVGCGLVVLAGLIGWAGTWKPRPKAPAPIFDRVRAEVGAAGSALASSRRTRAARSAVDDTIAEDVPELPGKSPKRAVNLVLIATLAGVILGRRL